MNTKYRSWNTDLGVFFYFLNGRYYKDADCKRLISERICAEFNWNNAEMFTGMTTKSYTEVYAGDIINCYDYSAIDQQWGNDKIHTGIIEWTSPSFSLKVPGKLISNNNGLKHWQDDVFLDYWCNAEVHDIIGNIHVTDCQSLFKN